MKKFTSKATLAIFSLLPTTAMAFATPNVTIKDPANNIDAPKIIASVIDWVLLLVGGITVLFIIFAGVQYVTAGGNKDRIEKAKQTLTYAIIGLIVIILAGVIVNLVIKLPTDVGLTK